MGAGARAIRLTGAILAAPRNRWSLGGLVVTPLLVGLGAELTNMTGALRFFLGLAYLSYGAFLRDLMVVIAHGGRSLPRWPSPAEFWGVGVDASLCCLFALGFWMPAVWLSSPWIWSISGGAGLGFCVIGLLLGGYWPFGSHWASWAGGLLIGGLSAAVIGQLIHWSRSSGPLFLLMSVLGPLLAALWASAFAHECAVVPAQD